MDAKPVVPAKMECTFFGNAPAKSQILPAGPPGRKWQIMEGVCGVSDLQLAHLPHVAWCLTLRLSVNGAASAGLKIRVLRNLTRLSDKMSACQAALVLRER